MRIRSPADRASPRRYWHVPALGRVREWHRAEMARLNGPTGDCPGQLIRVLEYLAANPGLEPEDLEVFHATQKWKGESARDLTAYWLGSRWWVRPTKSTWYEVLCEPVPQGDRRVKKMNRGTRARKG